MNQHYPSIIVNINLPSSRFSQVECSWGPPQDRSLQDLFILASNEMVRRSNELTYLEASDALLTLAAFTEEEVPHVQLQNAFSQTADFNKAPAIFLCRIFYAMTAIDLHKSGRNAFKLNSPGTTLAEIPHCWLQGHVNFQVTLFHCEAQVRKLLIRLRNSSNP